MRNRRLTTPILVGGGIIGLAAAIAIHLDKRRRGKTADEAIDRSQQVTWRMPPLDQLPPAQLTTLNRIWLIVLRGYLVLAAGLVLARIVQLAMTHV